MNVKDLDKSKASSLFHEARSLFTMVLENDPENKDIQNDIDVLNEELGQDGSHFDYGF